MLTDDLEKTVPEIVNYIIELLNKPIYELTPIDCHILDSAYFILYIKKEKEKNEIN